ncbi:MAG: hypothetical protein ACRCY8_18200, partial [Dermatophilaceae bacterium]
RRMEAAVRSRRVWVRPAPDGMAYLSVLGPLKDVVGAHAALQVRAKAVVGGQSEEEPPDGRGVGAVAADTALRLLSGRSVGDTQPVEVQLVITDRALLGEGDQARSPLEAARVVGHGSVPAPVARWWLRHGSPGSAWSRRLFASPDGRDLVGMDSRRRVFTGQLRRMLVLRDEVCTTPWCDAPVVHADHTHPARESGMTWLGNAGGKCERCSYTEEAPGWSECVISTGLGPGPVPGTTSNDHPGGTRDDVGADDVGRAGRAGDARAGGGVDDVDGDGTVGSAGAVNGEDDVGHRPRESVLRTPTGHEYRSVSPPLLGWGWNPPEPESALERHLVDLIWVA